MEIVPPELDFVTPKATPIGKRAALLGNFTRKIGSPDRAHSFRIDRKPLEKYTFQSIFESLVFIERFCRGFPKSWKSNAGRPFTYQDTPFPANYSANS